MTNSLNIVGHVYGRLSVIALHSNISYRKKFVCACVCGSEVVVAMTHLRTGHTQSCGCINVDTPPRLLHGMAGTALYKNYYQMLNRCHNPQSTTFHKYGAKGRIVCTAWRNSFEIFKAWAKSNGYAEGLTLDRKDNNGDYSPDNCRWVSTTTQNINKGVQVNNTSGYKGVTFKKSLGRWASRISIDKKRVHLGYFDTPEEAYTARVTYIKQNNLSDYQEALRYG